MSSKSEVELVGANSQAVQNPVIKLSWCDVETLLSRLPKAGRFYGVPRGGAICSGLTGRAADTPEEADYILDDIVDSGKTKSKWEVQYPGKPFLALVDKIENPNWRKWVHFPWEQPADHDVEDSVVRLLEFIGENPNREGLKDTPRRVIKAWKDLTVGYHQDPAQILATDFDGKGYDQMIISRRIDFNSTCEHHLLPFIGSAWVAYIPRKRVVGLSKLARLVDCFGKRLQIQEGMTEQIADAIEKHLKPRGVGVKVVAKHSCMSCRGVMKLNSDMVTTALRGAFRQHKTKMEFLMQCDG